MTQPKNSEHKVIAETGQTAQTQTEVGSPPPHSSPRQALRQQLRRKRSEIALEQKKAWDQAIGQKLMSWCQQNQPASLGVYWPIQAEPDLRPYYQQLQQAGFHLALPMVVGKDCPLSFLDWQAGDAMTADSYGIAIPAHGRQVALPAVLLIPCLGWNSTGYRLGYGGGFYDRTLASTSTNSATAIGIAYACTKAEFAAEAHDMPMDLIISA